jgi:pyruvate/2-oxoglutarate/acetoin dehydrogenase E1 component
MTAAAASRELLLDLQRRMLVIRAFEDEVMRLFMQNLVRGSTKATEGLHERFTSRRAREVIDPRTLRPLDVDTIAASVEKTSRLLCVQESPAPGSLGGDRPGRGRRALLAVARRATGSPQRGRHTGPLCRPARGRMMPTVDSIVAALRGLCAQ